METSYVILLHAMTRITIWHVAHQPQEDPNVFPYIWCPNLCYYSTIQQGGLDPTMDHQIIRMGARALAQSHQPCIIHVKINYVSIIDHKGPFLKIHNVTEYRISAKRTQTIHMHVYIQTSKHDLLQ